MPIKMPPLKKKDALQWGLILLPYLLLIPATIWYFKKLDNVDHSAFIVINKADRLLSLYNYKGELLQQSGVATGKNPGNKSVVGDNKTPEGIFTIASIENAAHWSHDFKDDTLGTIQGAYGPWFIRLNVPGQKGIGIHGTHDANSIGERASEGCIRMRNEDLIQLVGQLKKASVVVITPGVEDIQVNQQPLDTMRPITVPRPRLTQEKPARQVITPSKKSSDGKKDLKELLKDKHKTTVTKSISH
jgi:hypothetical protein